MMNILVLCPVLLAASVLTLTIDSQLGTSIEDCFERISIGEQLPPDAIYRNVTELTSRECEQICKQDKQCQSYDYGVGAKGNATCNLGNTDEKTLKEKNLLLRHPDYDVYIRLVLCEQSPPSPIQAQFDEPPEGPVHRPVFRPVDDQRQPFSDDYLISGDLESHGVKRPVYKPQYDERPDDYSNKKPDNDVGPSYGPYKPQDMPYRPERPSHNGSHSNRPDPYDVLQFQNDAYRPNNRPSYPQNDYNGPSRPPAYIPEKPEYHYIIRPNRKPKPQGDTGYTKPINDYPVRPSYGQADPGYTPAQTPYPNKEPYDRPRPGYQGPAAGYGQTSQYDDNSIHVEIKDPPRPYKPPKLTYGQGIYGYGTYSSQNSYSQSQSSSSQYYGSGTNSDNGYGSPYRPDPRPERPAYDEPNDTGYGSGTKPQKPSFDSVSPSYGSHKPSYNDEKPYGNNKPIYGVEKPPYRPEKPSYDVQKPSYGSEKPSYDEQKPSYGSERPSYDVQKPSYGSERPSYDEQKPSYGSERPSYDVQKPSYGSERPSYDVQKPSYGSEKPSYDEQKPSYGSERPSYDIQKPSYGSERPSYDEQKPSYGSERPSYDVQKPSYGSERPSFDEQKPSYGPERPSYDVQKPAYGSETPSYDEQKPAYGPERPSYGVQKPSHGSERPSYDEHKPAYGSERPSYDEPKPAYGPERPSYDVQKPSYGSERPSYDEQKPSYGSERPSYDVQKPSYRPERPVYGVQKPSYDSEKPAYGAERPSHDKPYGSDSGYGLQKPSHDYYEPAYGGTQGSYGGTQGSYGGSQGAYGSNQSSHGYGSYHDSVQSSGNYQGYGDSYGLYGGSGASGSQGLYGNQGYGSNQSDQGSYGGTQGSYGGSQGSYGSQSDYASGQGTYGGSQSTNKPSRPQYSYGVNQGSHDETSQTLSDVYGSQSDIGSSYGGSSGSYYGGSSGSYGGSSGSYEGSSGSYGGTQSDYNRPSYGNRPLQDQPSYTKPQKPKPSHENDDPGYGNSPTVDDNRPDYNDPDDPGYGSTDSETSGYGNGKSNSSGYTKPNIKPVYEHELERPANVPSYIARPGGGVVTSRPMLIRDYSEAYGRNPGKEPYKACFRRVLAGKRTLRSHVRKVVPCERLEDCREECAKERRFPCESFNYRLDRTFRGKGLCELMTKPIEAFDLRRDFVEDKDFDFFELDRNSLEPNCPDTLKGPGILHSGFLSSKTNRIRDGDSAQIGWRDKYDSFDGSHRDRFDRRGGYGSKRHEDRFFVPYQINQGLARTDDVQENWGKYGGDYGGYDSYYKDKNDYHKSMSHWRLGSDIERPSFGVKTLSNTNFDYHTLGKNGGTWVSNRYGFGSWKRGRWNGSGSSNALDYGESNFYKPKSHFHETNTQYRESIDRSDDGKTKDCSSRRSPGMSLGTGAIRRSLISRNVVECETACFSEREFKCVSYSYRYSNNHGTDNCFLSERPYRGLELSADSSSDVYAMPQDQGCVTINYKPWVESECFWHVRSGAAVSDTAVRAALTVGGLGACEAECIRAHAFFCRGFSFRFDSPAIGDDLENCILTSSPPTSLENGRGLRPNSGHELYARGNYGRGCEPALYDDVQHRDDECYLQYDKAAKLTGSAIRGQARVKDEQSCGHACNEAPFRCLSFSFNNNAPPDVDNCLLSEIRLFDLQRGVDYVHSVDDWLFAFDLFNGQCWRKVHAMDYDEAPEIPRPLSAPPVEEPFSVSGPSGPPGPPGIIGSSAPSGPSGPGFAPEHHEPPSPFIPVSGPPSGPGHKPYSSGPELHGFKPEYPETVPSYKPHYPPSGPHKPYQEPSGPDFKPGYPGPSYKPGYSPPAPKPVYSGPSGPSFKPGFDDPIGPNFKPPYRPPNPNYEPEYPAEPSGPSYKPGYLPDSDLKPNYRPSGPPQRPVYRPSRPEYVPEKPGYISEKPGYFPGKPGYVPEKPGYLPEKPGYLPDHRPAYPGPNRPIFDEQRPSRPSSKPGYPDRVNEEPISVSWRHYTVSGFPCRAGTTCAQNQVAGHWACEPESAEIGSWDYCCAPTHRCGYSEGFHKPWCYVGPEQDQWRPCSEKYYPYHQHKVPHPSQGHHSQEIQHSPVTQYPPGHAEGRPNLPLRPATSRPWQSRPGYDRPSGPPGPYLSEGDRKYWDDLYKNGPQAYYDKYGNPLPGYSRVPTESRPHIKYTHNDPRPGSGTWLPVSSSQDSQRTQPTGLGVPRYWPVAYLHKGPPPNTTYFQYNETQQQTTTTSERYTSERYTTERYTTPREQPVTSQPKPDNTDNHRDEKKRNMSDYNDVPETTTIKVTTTTTELPEVKEEVKENITDVVELVKPEVVKITDTTKIKGIDDKLDDFSRSLEVFDLDDVKGAKMSDLKTVQAEERQIEEIGRILASRRGGKLVLDRRSQKELEAKSIAVDKELVDFNFGNRFPAERRGKIQKVSKDEIERERLSAKDDKSLEVSETSFVRPPRVLSTTDNIRKAIINGKVYYDATIREQRDAFLANSTRRSKSLRTIDDSKLTNLTSSGSFGKKIIKPRNVNPVRRVRRVYRKRYNPDEVRRRLLEREKSKQEKSTDSSRKI